MEQKDKNETKIYTHESSKDNKAHGFLLGTLAIIAGVLLLLLNSDLFAGTAFSNNLKHLIFSWPMILVVVSLFSFSKGDYKGGLLVLFIGLVFLVPRAAFLFPGIGYLLSSRNVLYIGLIVIGCIIIINSIDNRKDSHDTHRSTQGAGFGNASMKTDDARRINYNFTFSGAEQIYLEPVFYGGDVKCTFGGLELDLMHTSLPEGETVLNVKGVCGGINLHIPSDWYVEIRSNCVLGGFTDSRQVIGNPDYSRKLIINAKCTLGGGNIE